MYTEKHGLDFLATSEVNDAVLFINSIHQNLRRVTFNRILNSIDHDIVKGMAGVVYENLQQNAPDDLIYSKICRSLCDAMCVLSSDDYSSLI